MIRPSLLCGLFLLASGCTHNRVIERATAGPEAYSSASQSLRNREGELLTNAGEIFRWYNVSLTPDTTFGIPRATGIRSDGNAIPTTQVVEVTVRSRGRGILDGVLIGAGTGALFGLLVPVDEGCSDYFGPCPETRGQQALLTGLGGALWGVIFGAIFPAKLKVSIR